MGNSYGLWYNADETFLKIVKIVIPHQLDDAENDRNMQFETVAVLVCFLWNLE